MSLKLDFAKWNNVFAVSTDIVDKHILAASGLAIKVILLFIRNSDRDLTVCEIAKTLGVDKSDVTDAINYWRANGYLLDSDNPSKEQPEKPKTEYQKLNAQSITGAQLAQALNENDDLKNLMAGAEEQFGRLLTTTEQKIFVNIYEYLSLPVDVILMIIAHCISLGKSSARYIEKTAVGWSDMEIDTHEKASAYIERVTKENDNFNLVKKCFGIFDRNLTSKEKQFINTWFCDYGFEINIIKYAYEKTVDSIGKPAFAYINRILQNWYQCGAKTMQDIARLDDKFEAGKKSSASYNIDEFEKMGIDDIPNL